MSNFRRPKHLTTRRMQETRPNPPKEQAKAQRPAREIRWNCPVAAKCGGCQLTRLSYAEQLQWKQQRVAELLDGICEVRPILGMDDPFHYRNKVHAVLAVDKAGRPISGVYAMGTHRVVPVRHCLVEDRRADRIIQTIVAMLPAYKLRIYNEYTHRGFLRHILIRTGHVTGQIMVVLVATSLEFPGKKAFVQELIQRHPEITTVVLNCNQRETSMVLGTKEITLYGEGYMEDELCGKRFRISPQSFYQVNAKQCEVLYRTAIDAAQLTGAADRRRNPAGRLLRYGYDWLVRVGRLQAAHRRGAECRCHPRCEGERPPQRRGERALPLRRRRALHAEARQGGKRA